MLNKFILAYCLIFGLLALPNSAQARIKGQAQIGGWAFEGNLNDFAGTHTGTATGTPTTSAAGRFGNAITLNPANATTDYVSFGNLGTVTAYTVSLHFKLNDATNYPNLFDMSLGDNNNGLRAETNGNTLGIYGNTSTVNLNITTTLTLSAWHHLVLTWDGTTFKAYLDGAQTNSVASGSAPVNGFAAVTLGTGFDNGSIRKANMLADEFTVFNRALTVSEINSLASNFMPGGEG